MMHTLRPTWESVQPHGTKPSFDQTSQ